MEWSAARKSLNTSQVCRSPKKQLTQLQSPFDLLRFPKVDDVPAPPPPPPTEQQSSR